MLHRCIRLDLDCADVCDAVGKLLSHQRAFEPRWWGPPFGHARKRIACAMRSASGTPGTTSTAGCALRLVGAARARNNVLSAIAT